LPGRTSRGFQKYSGPRALARPRPRARQVPEVRAPEAPRAPAPSAAAGSV